MDRVVVVGAQVGDPADGDPGPLESRHGVAGHAEAGDGVGGGPHRLVGRA